MVCQYHRTLFIDIAVWMSETLKLYIFIVLEINNYNKRWFFQGLKDCSKAAAWLTRIAVNDSYFMSVIIWMMFST